MPWGMPVQKRDSAAPYGSLVLSNLFCLEVWGLRLGGDIKMQLDKLKKVYAHMESMQSSIAEGKSGLLDCI